MLMLNPSTRIWVAVSTVDFRRGIDGLAEHCRVQLEYDPMSGALFVFRNKARTAIKILAYDGQGFWLCQKRFSVGKIKWWPSRHHPACPFAARELQVLLWNGTPDQADMADDWRPLKLSGGG